MLTDANRLDSTNIPDTLVTVVRPISVILGMVGQRLDYFQPPIYDFHNLHGCEI